MAAPDDDNLSQPGLPTASSVPAPHPANGSGLPVVNGSAVDRLRRDVSETSDLSSLDGDGDDLASRTAAAAANAAAGQSLPATSLARSTPATALLEDGAALSSGELAASGGASLLDNGSVLPPASTASTVGPFAAKAVPPPAPRSLSSALSSPGSPAGSNSSDPTAETEPLAGSPRPDDLDDDDDDDDEAEDERADEDDDEEDDNLEPTSAMRSPSKTARSTSAGAAAPRAPSAPPTAKANGKPPTSPGLATALPVRASTSSPKTALQGKQEELRALGIWKADEEGDSDLTPDEESDAAADEEDDDDRMDVDKPTVNGKESTPQPSTWTSTSGAASAALDDDQSAASSAAEDDEYDDAVGSRPQRATRSRRASQASRKAPISEDDAGSDSSDDDDDPAADAQLTPNGAATKKAGAVAAASPTNSSKAAPRTVNGDVLSAGEKSPVVPQSEELSPPPTSPGPSNADEDEDDEDDAADDDDDDGKTPTKAKPDVRFNLMTAGTTADAGGLFQADEEMEEDDDDEASDDEVPTTGGINGEVPEVRIEEAPEVNATGEEVDPEASGAEAEEAALPDTPVLGGPENESSFPIALNLQAQQRLDAMEALSKIEIAFARLRDLMHLERMEECAREEEKLLNDTHPLLTQVQTRLTALRDRELSSIEARHVVATKESALVEKADVSGIWEWWRNGREELQKDMMADVMRKRRRVDREKRAVEGGRPKRPLPVPPAGPPRAANREDPRLEDLLPTSYLSFRPDEKRKMREEREAWGPRPGLVGLDERGRDNDLDMLGIGPSTRHQQHQPQLFRPFDAHGPPMMGGPPMHPHHHGLQGQPPMPYHTLHPHASYPPPPPHPSDGVYVPNRAPFPYRPPMMAPYQAEPHLQGHHPPMPLPPHQGGHPPHMAGLQPPFAEAYGKPPASVVIARPPPGSGGHHATGRAIMPTSSLPAGPEVGHASYATFDMAFGGGGGGGGGAGPSGGGGAHPANGQQSGGGNSLESGSPHKRARTGSPVGFRTLGVV